MFINGYDICSIIMSKVSINGYDVCSIIMSVSLMISFSVLISCYDEINVLFGALTHFFCFRFPVKKL